ncbi:MAG: cytochrome c4 [Phyllobacteriaceae bacterium]|nr:cytochrome c4 [Phyllobacteriaceae bacterium]
MGRSVTLVFAAALAAFIAAPALADDIADGEKLYKTKTCMACHGLKGARPIQTYPALAGQNEKYLLTQMQDIKSAKRIASKDPATGHPYTEGMQAVMHLLNDDELKTIAKYLTSLEPGKPKAIDPPPSQDDLAAGLAAFKKLGCVACHGADGKKTNVATYPIIAGLQRDYLVRQMTDMRDGVRVNGQSKLMLGVIKKADDAAIAAIANYISQVDRSAK